MIEVTHIQGDCEESVSREPSEGDLIDFAKKMSEMLPNHKLFVRDIKTLPVSKSESEIYE